MRSFTGFLYVQDAMNCGSYLDTSSAVPTNVESAPQVLQDISAVFRGVADAILTQFYGKDASSAVSVDAKPPDTSFAASNRASAEDGVGSLL